MRWPSIATAPTTGHTRIIARDGYGHVRQTWWGKASHVPLYGWCWMRHPNDFENVELWEPTHWRPADRASEVQP